MGAFTYGYLFGLLAAYFFLPGMEAKCPPAWFEFQSYCYGVTGNSQTWMASEDDCQANGFGSHLASLHSEEEHVAVANYLTENFSVEKEIWIALNNPHHTEIWEWSDSSPFFYQAWSEGEPNNARGNEYCVHLLKNAGYMTWNDDPCESAYLALCKLKL